MGDRPVYTVYRPFHLSPLEAPLTVARVLTRDLAQDTPITLWHEQIARFG